jgi:hypothetical protein
MNRYELRQFNAKKARGLVATKGGLCRALGLPNNTLDAYAMRHPELFPKPAYVVETKTGGVRMFYSKREVQAFLEIRKGVKKPYRSVPKRAGVSKYEDYLKRIEAMK